MNNAYWNNIINGLTDKKKAAWAAHVLSSNIEILEDILLVIDKESLLKIV